MDYPTNYRESDMQTLKIAVIACLVALSIGTNYALIGVWNVKLMDFIVFVGGFCFGSVVGVLIGVVSWSVYGTLNPQGFVLPILLATMFSETIYGIAGGLVRKGFDSVELKSKTLNAYVFFGTLGIFLTLTYDVVTNIVFGYVSGVNVILAVVIGFFPFGLFHVISNAVFFGLGCVPTINAVFKVTKGEQVENHKE